MIETTKNLHRANAGGLIGGVCAGLGAYFGIDATLIRIGWMLLTLLGGAGILVYLIAWSIIPDEEGRRTLAPLLLLAVGVVLPMLLALLWLVPITVTTSR